jgi:hypothetical protein
MVSYAENRITSIGIQKMRKKTLKLISLLGIHQSGGVLDNDDFCYFPI